MYSGFGPCHPYLLLGPNGSHKSMNCIGSLEAIHELTSSELGVFGSALHSGFERQVPSPTLDLWGWKLTEPSAQNDFHPLKPCPPPTGQVMDVYIPVFAGCINPSTCPLKSRGVQRRRAIRAPGNGGHLLIIIRAEPQNRIHKNSFGAYTL